ncbi:peptidase M48 [Mycobacterium kyorinense]|uniref:Peptidase M48 n=1 Tax=Mycobacterium kyorinense TaxID=487514 RepID=A0A1A2ZJU0_9MYCO|nr:M56 family metallopeptidase [Mycobacterium kyorinense]OBI49742.1 peptidase M48 [Mycobacterium kyorinense]
MNAATVILLYAAALTWLAPPLLRRVTAGGIHPRLGVAAWLTAVGGAVAAWFAALAVLLVDAVASMWRNSALTLCLKVLGFAGHIGVPQPIGSALALGLLVTGLGVTPVVALNVTRRLRRMRSHSHRHALTARMIGHATDRPGVVVIPGEEAAAYCVTGRPPAVVVTTAARDRLDEPQLAAVLAHEAAHLSGRHHDVLMVLRALAAALPRLPLFPAAADGVAGLLEMCADDIAVRRHGTVPLLGGLLALVGQPPVASAALGAADSAVVARAERLALPAPGRIRWRDRLVLTSVIGLWAAAPMTVMLTCQL